MHLHLRSRTLAVGSVAAVGLAGVVILAPVVAAEGPRGFAYVVNNDSGSVTTISVSTGGTANIDVGDGPTAVAISPDGSQAYVTNGRSNDVSVIDTASKDRVATIPVGSRPSGVAFGTDGRTAYVSNTGSDNVSIIDTRTRKVVRTVPVGKGPAGILVTPNNKTVVVANNGSTTLSGIPVANPGTAHEVDVKTKPTAIAMTPDGSKVLIANKERNDVSVVEIASGKVIDTIGVGRGPSGIAVTPDGTRTYVSNMDSNDVTVLDTSTEKVDSIYKVKTIGVGARPIGVAVSPDGAKVYVPNNGGRKTSVIRTSDNDVTTTDVQSGPTAVATGVPQELSAVVTLGDSFISGIGGRWQGNSLGGFDVGPDLRGTNRAVFDCATHPAGACKMDPRIVYGSTYQEGAGCMRSYSAEALSAELPVYRSFNIACSGAETKNIIDTPLKGEPPQSTQLAALAQRYKVKMVVLNVGGNDIGFRGIITSCVLDFTLKIGPCNDSKRPEFREGLQRAQAGLQAAVRKIRDVMRANNHPDDSYRLVLQSYPSPVPFATDFRYDESFSVRERHGCPVYNVDANWIRAGVVPGISRMIGDVAVAEQTETLDVLELFNGHEVCAKGVDFATAQNWYANPLLGSQAEWARFLDAIKPYQGNADESVHPNYYGQNALGTCLNTLYDYDGDKPYHQCRNVPGKGAEHVTMDHQD